MGIRGLLLVVFAIAVGGPTGVQAQEPDGPSDADVTAARAHFEEGSSLYDQGRFLDAAQRFEAAYGLAPRPVILYNLGLAYEGALELGRAADAYERYLETPGRSNEAEVRSRIARLRELAGGPSMSGPASPPPEEEPSTSDESSTDDALGIWAAVTGGGALVLTGLAIGSGVAALGEKNTLDANCGSGMCPTLIGGEPSQDTIDSADSLSVVSTALGFAGLAVGAVAVVLTVLAIAGRSDDESPVVALAPFVGPGTGGVVVGGAL